MSNWKSVSGAPEGVSAEVHIWRLLTPRKVEAEVGDEFTWRT